MSNKALISVSDKTGVLPLAQTLSNADYEILSTGGTAKMLKESGVAVTLVEDYTGFAEMMNGRVKTLQPKIHAGILADRRKEDHLAQMKERGMDLIDVVVVNLYPFEKVVANKDCSLDNAIENIDIGGVALIRAAAKNYHSTAIICKPDDYSEVEKELASDKKISLKLREKLAVKAFGVTKSYDSAIESYLSKNIAK